MKSFLKSIKTEIEVLATLYLYLFIDFLADLSLLSARKTHSDVVIIRLDAIGDFILWLHSFPEYLRCFKGKKITMICQSPVSEIAGSVKGIDHVVAIHPKKFLPDLIYQFRIIRSLKKVTYDFAIMPVISRTIYMDLVVKSISAEIKIGTSGDFSNRSGKMQAMFNGFYSRLLEIAGNRHELEMNRDFAAKVFAVNLKDPSPACTLLLPGIDLMPQSFCVVGLGASDSRKIWLCEKFAGVCEGLDEELQIVLVGGDSEKSIGDEFISLSKHPDRIINKIGAITLTETIAYIKNAKLVICNDTCFAHMAALEQTPAVAVISGVQFGRFLPYPPEMRSTIACVYKKIGCFGCNRECRLGLTEGQWHCLGQVNVEDVQRTVLLTYARQGASQAGRRPGPGF